MPRVFSPVLAGLLASGGMLNDGSGVPLPAPPGAVGDQDGVAQGRLDCAARHHTFFQIVGFVHQHLAAPGA
jgi:hypothetical protein